jgi:hypothetical protein
MRTLRARASRMTNSPRGDEDFLVGEGDFDARGEGLEHGGEPGRADHGEDDQIGLAGVDEIEGALGAGEPARAVIDGGRLAAGEAGGAGRQRPTWTSSASADQWAQRPTTSKRSG